MSLPKLQQQFKKGGRKKPSVTQTKETEQTLKSDAELCGAA